MSGALMSIGQTAMTASYAALQTASNNIANANTAGYSRQTAMLADAPSQFTGSGFFGKGVNVTTIARAYNGFLTGQAVTTASTAAADSARLGQLTQLQGVFPIGAGGLGAAAGSFINSFVDLANNPSDSSARQVVLSQAQQLATHFAAAGNQLSAIQSGLTQTVKTSVDSLNQMAAQVAGLNRQISALRGNGQAPNQLLDQRDQLVSKIAGLVNVSTIPADDGSIGLFIGGGQNLVLGANANTVKAVPDAFDPSKVALALSTGGSTTSIPANSLSGGSLSGLLNFQNNDLTTANQLVGQLATSISSAANQQQALGLDLRQPAGAGAPLFSVGTPAVLAAGSNTGTASLSLSVNNGAQVQASDYTVKFDGTNYAVVRSSDNAAVAGSPYTAAQLSAGVQFDGVSLQRTGGAPAAGDRFLLQPVSQAAQHMTTVLADPSGIAAASPFVGSVGVNNSGTASIASLNATSPSYNGALSANITFTDNAGNYTWSLSNGGVVSSSGTGLWTAGTPIGLNGFQMSLAGVPRANDTLAVVPTTSVRSNNGNATAFSDLGTAGLVASGNGGPAQTITDGYASALANIGVRVQGGTTTSTASTAAASQAETARSNSAGVNLDEEAARLIQYQQSYQAAAKILQVAKQIFDTLLQTAAG
ncbi:MAG: flagellar hook-associated protein FlgK [Pseudomonadota bacterium]|nr:flagellar hook-associated protein FlgK [Pseudomonadota bacterium]